MTSRAKDKGEEATAKREDATSFMEDSVSTNHKTGHDKLPEATVPRGDSIEILSSVEASGETDQVKHKKQKEALEGVEKKWEDETGTDLVSQLEELKEKLAIAEGEMLTLEQEKERYKTKVEQLHGDLEVTRHESAKVGKTKSEKEGVLALRVQLAAQKAEQDQLQLQLEQTEATVRQLETNLNLSKARVAELEEGATGTALCESEHDRQGLFQQLSEVKEQRNTLDQKCLSLLALNENLKSQASQAECVLDEITQVKREASRWKEMVSTKSAEVEAVRRENADLKGEIEARKAEAVLWEEDFRKERHDREQAAGRMDDERVQLRIQSQLLQEDVQKFHARIHQLESQNKLLQDEIKIHQDEMKHNQQFFHAQQRKHKAQLEQSNRLQRTQLEDAHQQLRKANQQLDQAITDNEKLNEDVLAKTQQVKQYKKRVDGLKAEVATKQELLSRTIAEKDALLQAAHSQLRQQTQEKDRFIQALQSENDQLRQQVQRYAQRSQSQHSHESDFWEVPRDEITLVKHKILGIGAWGFVVEGKFRGQKVAVKCLHDMIRQPEVIATIRKEIGIMAQIRHPNMVMLIAAVIDEKNDPLIVTELLEISLRKAYENHRLQGSSRLSIFQDIASALNYLHLHQRGEIIHRDVSSANVLLEAKPNNQWKAKLSDFGSAKLAIEAKTTGPGAPAYTAPEVRKEMGIRQTAKLDVYSYGILLCEVIVEQFPVDGSLSSMMQVLQSRWPYMHGLVTSCIQEHPDNRPTMSYVLGEFDKFRPKE